MKDLQLPSVNNSLMEPQPARQIYNKHLYENTDINRQEPASHKDSSSLKNKYSKDERNEKKATKKEFEANSNILKSERVNQDEIDRNSTVKKMELNENIENQADGCVKPEDGPPRSKVKDYKLKEDPTQGKLDDGESLGKHTRQSIDEDANENVINFDGRKSGEDKTFNYSVLSRSKSGDAKVQSNSKGEKESINTAGELLYYGKSKESQGAKQVLIEEIEIPLDEQNEIKKKERKRSEKEANNKKKIVVEDHSKI